MSRTGHTQYRKPALSYEERALVLAVLERVHSTLHYTGDDSQSMDDDAIFVDDGSFIIQMNRATLLQMERIMQKL